jgi:NAD(P)-dependent dehydrogenase (short-subunit alcohol dehydrogenase family)
MRTFDGRGALITGGASGIGLALGRAVAKKGMRVILCDRDAATLEGAARDMRSAGATVLALAFDVTDRARWQEAEAEVRGFGPLHVVCANAGIAPGGAPLSRLSPEAWDRIIAVNLTAVFNTVQATAPLVREHGQGGHYVLTSSIAGMLAAGPIADYAVTKFGVSAMGEALRTELAPEGIGVSVLYPGVVATPLGGGSEGTGMSPDAVASRVVEAIEGDELFVFTHADYRPLVQARLEAVLSAFGASAQAGFVESPAVLAMMKSTPYQPLDRPRGR